MTADHPFWHRKKLHEFSAKEWEDLCDRCGLCCMHKLEDVDTGRIYRTSIACDLLDKESCSCLHYRKRFNFVPDCVRVTQEIVQHVNWLPETCAYRLIAQGKDLPPWHHLQSNDKRTVHEKGVSVRGKIARYESEVEKIEDYFSYIVEDDSALDLEGKVIVAQCAEKED